MLEFAVGKISCVKVHDNCQNSKTIFKAVEKSLNFISWNSKLKKGTVILKINAVWDKLYPGCTTTPMVIEGVLKLLLATNKFLPQDITIVDTDTAAMKRADNSFKVQGIYNLAKRYGVKLINLSKTDFTEVSFSGQVLKKLKISKVILEADNIITIPVLKTHAYSGITASLKNQWGCIHDLRHNYHLVLNQAIADVNLYLKDKIKFAVID